MYQRLRFASAMIALLTGCDGMASSPWITPAASHAGDARIAAVESDATSNAVANPGFESGSNSPWTSCGSVSGPKPSTVQAHTGSYGELIGTTAKPEVDGTKAVCQTVTVPASATLTFWVYEGTDDTLQYVDQEADILSTSGTQLAQLYAEAKTTGGWVQKSFNLSSYAGQTVQLYFGIKGDGYASDYVYLYLDDVSLTGNGTPTAAPSSKPTTSPPTASPTTAAFACNDGQFGVDQNAFAAGTIAADQPEDVCGSVTQVLAEKDTSSGHHGYFYVALPSGYQIEIVSNLDAMAEASTDRPPATWPWIAVDQYVYVQGRYYYDSSSSQGIDWTEDDTSSSWSHLGYVAVCDDNGNGCQKYW